MIAFISNKIILFYKNAYLYIQNTYGLVISRMHHLFSVPCHIGVDPAKILVAELVHLHLNEHMALEDTMIEHQTHNEIFIVRFFVTPGVEIC